MTQTSLQTHYESIRSAAKLAADLETEFYETATYQNLRHRIFQVLEAREARLSAGLTEQKGVALLGPAGVGKSRMIDEIRREFCEFADGTGGRVFGSKIVSVIVPGQASIKGTCVKILHALGYPIEANRSEDYLFKLLSSQLAVHRVAALHLDEVQDSGRYKTSNVFLSFAKRFRNLMQDEDWPVCLILTATLEAKEFLNHEPTLTRRIRPIEILPISAKTEKSLIQSALRDLLSRSKVNDDALFNETEFLKILVHASAARFGILIEIAIEAIVQAAASPTRVVTLDHFAEAYFARSNSDDERNPFVTKRWKDVDTTKIIDRYLLETKTGVGKAKRR